jgi:hypothetical protein
MRVLSILGTFDGGIEGAPVREPTGEAGIG